MNTIRDSGFVLKEGARLLTELKRLHDRLHRGQINLVQATDQGIEQLRASREAIPSAQPPPLPLDDMPPWKIEPDQITRDSLKEALQSEKPDALAAYTSLSATNPASEYLAGEIVAINYNNAVAGADARPEVSAKAVESYNKALRGDLNAGLEYLQVKHRDKEATEAILKEAGRAIGKQTKTLSGRDAEVLKKKTTEFLKEKTSPARFRAEFSRMGQAMGTRM